MVNLVDVDDNDLVLSGYNDERLNRRKDIYIQLISGGLEEKDMTIDDLDVDYAVEQNISPFTESDLLDGAGGDYANEYKAWVNAAKMLHSSVFPDSYYETQDKAFSNLPEETKKAMVENRGQSFSGMRNYNKPVSDEDFAKWGVEYIGAWNYNFANMGDTHLTLKGEENDIAALALYHMSEVYGQLPMFTWNGTKRFFKGIASDPVSYFAAGGPLLQLKNLVKPSSKHLSLNSFARAALSPTAITAYEGGAYTALDDAFRQWSALRANEAGVNQFGEAGDELGQQEFDWGRMRQATSTGVAAGLALGGAVKGVAKGAEIVAPKVGEAVSSATAATRQFFINQGKLADIRLKEQGGGTKLMSGFDPTDFINEGLSKLGKSLEDTVQPDNLGYIFKSEKAVLETPQQKGDVSQWKGIFQKAGIKQDEMKWLGLNEFFEGKQTVTKEEIAEYIAQNKFHLDEVELKDIKDMTQNIEFNNLDQSDAAFSHIQKRISGEKEMEGDTYQHTLKNISVGQAGDSKYYIVEKSTTKNGENWEEGGNFMIFVQKGETTENEGLAEIIAHYAMANSKSFNEAMVQAESIAMRTGDMASPKNTSKFERFTEPGGTNYREIILTNPDFNKNKEGEPAITRYSQTEQGEFTYNSDPELRDFSATMAPFNAEMERLSKRIFEIDHRMAEMGIEPNSQNRTLLQPTGGTPEGIERNNLIKERRELLDEHDRVSNEKAQTGARILQRQNFTAAEHWGDIENPVVHARISDRVAEDGGKILYIEEAQSDWGQRGRQKRYDAISDFAYESSGFDQEIPIGPLVGKTEQFTKAIVRRLIKKAVDEGYDYISLSTGQVQATRWGETGLIPYYDEILPGIMDKVVGELQEGKPVQFDNVFTKIDSDRDINTSIMLKNKKLKNVGITSIDAVKLVERDNRNPLSPVNQIQQRVQQRANDRITIKITDEMRASVEKGMPMFELGAAVGGAGIGAAIANQEENPI